MTALVLLLSMLSCVTIETARRSETRTDLGTAYLKEGNAPGAVQALQEAASLNPRNATAWERLALAYMASNAHKRSEAAFTTAIKLGTSEEPARVVYNYGLLLVKLGRLEEALAAFETTLSDLTYRTPAKALNSKGYTLYTMGRFDEAIAVLSDAIRRVPKLCQARFHRGLTYQATDQPQEALDDFEGVIQVCGEEANGAYYHAAQALFSLNDQASGCTYLRTALRDAKTDEFAGKIRELSRAECGA
jgi:tetratricopeptide (TPR) repeat protein